MKNWESSFEWIGQENPTVCPSCSGNRLETTIEEEVFTYGKGDDACDLRAQVPVHHCTDCDIDFTDGFAERLRHAAICEHLGVMTPDDVAAVRKSYGISRTEFARLTKIGEASLSRWENGNLVQNAAYDQFLHLLTYPENVERLYQRMRIAETDMSADNAADKFQILAQDGTLERKRREAERFTLRLPA